MLRTIYTLLLYLLAPVLAIRLFWRSYSFGNPAGWRQRLALYDNERVGQANREPEPTIWLHAVSLGETRAAEPLVKSLLAEFPHCRLLLSTTTPTGLAAAAELFAQSIADSRMQQCYLPWDFPAAMRRFLCHYRPSVALLLETEIWPNMLAACESAGIPVALVNARLSCRSARGYLRVAYLSRVAFASLHTVIAQSRADARRLRLCGARQVSVCGNIKFDIAPSPGQLFLGQQWRQGAGERLIWLAASTREHAGRAEEDLLLEAHEQLLASWPGDLPAPLLTIVPRHPQRFDQVSRLIEKRGFQVVRRSVAPPPAASGRHDRAVWLCDSMGELTACYRLTDMAFIGGSLLPLGGQNLIEAAACGCPMLLGPYTFNFASASRQAQKSGAAIQVGDSAQLALVLAKHLLDNDARAAMSKAALEFAKQQRGATRCTMSELHSMLSLLPAPLKKTLHKE